MSTSAWSPSLPCPCTGAELRAASGLRDLDAGVLQGLAAAARGGEAGHACPLWTEEQGSPGAVLLVHGSAEVQRRPASDKAPTAWWATAGDLLAVRAGERSAARLAGPGRVLVLPDGAAASLPGWPARERTWERLE